MGRRNWRIGREKGKEKRPGENFPIFPFRKKKRLATCLITDLLQAKECSCLQSNTPQFPKRIMKKKFLLKSSTANCSPLSPINTWSGIFPSSLFTQYEEIDAGYHCEVVNNFFSSSILQLLGCETQWEEEEDRRGKEGREQIADPDDIKKAIRNRPPSLFHPPNDETSLPPSPLSI